MKKLAALFFLGNVLCLCNWSSALQIAEGTHAPDSKWRRWEGLTDIEEKPTLRLNLQAEQPVSSDRYPTLYIQCGSGKLNVAVNTAVLPVTERIESSFYLGRHPEFARIRFKFDDGKIHQDSWDIGADKTNLFKSHPKEFLRDLLKAKRMLFQFRPYGEDPFTAEFDVEGLDSAMLNSDKGKCGL